MELVWLRKLDWSTPALSSNHNTALNMNMGNKASLTFSKLGRGDLE